MQLRSEDTMKFKLDKTILYDDFDEHGKLATGRVVTAFQDTINAHSQAIGRGIDYMVETGRTWYLIAWNVEIHRLPGKYEHVTLSTWGYETKRSLGMRNVTMTDDAGEVIICGDSIWTLADIHTGTPLRIMEDDLVGYETFPKYEGMTYLGRHVKAEGEFELAETVRVRRSDIDYNMHMSNANYVELAYEYIPGDLTVTRIHAEYKAQTKYHETVDCLVSHVEDKYYVKIVGHENGEEKCVVCFTVA